MRAVMLKIALILALLVPMALVVHARWPYFALLGGSWESQLAAAVEGADRLRVRTGGTCHRDVANERTLYEEKNPTKIQELVNGIKINESESGFACMCCGDPSLEFYKGDTLVLTVGYHHGRSMRWPGSWRGDALLTPDSANYLQRWLAERIPEIKESQERERAQRQQEAQSQDLFVSFFPENVRTWLRMGGEVNPDQGDKELGSRIAAAMPDQRDLLTAACRAFGTLRGRDAAWNMTGGKERRVLNAIEQVDGTTFPSVLEDLKDSGSALVGAARLFFAADFEQHVPVEARDSWRAVLAEAALTDGADVNKPTVVRRLGVATDQVSLILLRDVMNGMKGTAIQRPEYEDPSLRCHAAMSLGLREDVLSKPDVERLVAEATNPSDVAACQVALALLGDPKRLRIEQFQVKSYIMGLSAVRAVERFGGAHGMELLVTAGLHHHWARVGDEAEQVVERLTGLQWPEATRLQGIEEWWRKEGPAFVEQKRKASSIR